MLVISFILSPFFYKVLSVPLNIIFLIFILILLLFLSTKRKFKLRSNKVFLVFLFLFFIYNFFLLISTINGLNYPNISTGIYSDPYIPEYIKLNQIILGFVYNNILFLYMIFLLLLIKILKMKDEVCTLKKIEKIIYIFSFIILIFNFLELLIPELHEKLMIISGYKNLNYFFITRPVSLVFNSYLNAFFTAYFTFFSLHYFFERKKTFFLIFYFIGIITIFIVGARYALILILISSFTYLLLLRKIRFMIYSLFYFIVIGIIFFFLNKNYLEIIYSIIILSDKVGSANLHKELFLKTLNIINENILGFGVGKADFGALNTLPNFAFNPESYLLSLLIGGGLLSFYIFILIHFFLLRALIKKKLFYVFSFNLGVLLVSFINIQILQSLTATFIIAILYIYVFISIRRRSSLC